MNQDQLENEVKTGLARLIKAVDAELGPAGKADFAGAEPRPALEHNTRRMFLDGVLELLKWSLGPGGNMAEEARVKAETVTYMDYVGVSATQVPLVIVEAKAWDKPFVSARPAEENAKGDTENAPETPQQLIARGIAHVRDRGKPEASPVTSLWHDYLKQVHGYVSGLYLRHSHSVARVVLTSGRWMVIFRDPMATFVGPGSALADQIAVFHIGGYVAASTAILRLIGRPYVAPEAPRLIRPTQLPAFAPGARILRTFRGLHVYHEAQRNRFSGPQPVIRCTPTLIVQRDDQKLIGVMDETERVDLPMFDLAEHLAAVAAGADRLHSTCQALAGRDLEISPLSAFPGFSTYDQPGAEPDVPFSASRRQYVELQSEGDEWLMATGEQTHFLIGATSPAAACAFHAWSESREAGYAIGDHAIGRPSVNPRAFYTDGHPNHCAHQGVHDLREPRCHLAPLDSRLCCMGCVYQEACWLPVDRAPVGCPPV